VSRPPPPGGTAPPSALPSRFHTFPLGAGDGGYAFFLGRKGPDKGVHIAARAARAAGLPHRIAAKMREPAELAYFDEQVARLLGGTVEYVRGGTCRQA